MTKFHFIYHDGGELVFEASEAKHFTGHVVLIDAVLVRDTSCKLASIIWGTKFSRFNLALNGNLVGMYPKEDPEPLEESKSFVANCTGWCAIHGDTLTYSGKCPKCEREDIPF